MIAHRCAPPGARGRNVLRACRFDCEVAWLITGSPLWKLCKRLFKRQTRGRIDCSLRHQSRFPRNPERNEAGSNGMCFHWVHECGSPRRLIRRDKLDNDCCLHRLTVQDRRHGTPCPLGQNACESAGPTESRQIKHVLMFPLMEKKTTTTQQPRGDGGRR